MMQKNAKTAGLLSRRMTALLMSLVLLLGLFPITPDLAKAADWTQEYLDTLVSWGVMRGDISGALHGDREITRAEFVTMMNRAYGYTEPGAHPFTDVPTPAWYYDDISIAYEVGYFDGTSETTASPDDSLTREQAAVLLARNMMLQEKSGETLGFSDSREFSEWSRNLIQSVSDAGVISGYPDGTFRPQGNITRGEVACMLVRAVGTPIQTEGIHTLGSMYGNVTINTPGVQLKNTIIAGDLYLTGGVGLGEVLLENVTVLGRIVASGAGESSKGESSIVLRNVDADEMVVDSIANQFVTIRAEGNTVIGSTSVRTSSYIEDTTRSGLGLKYITLDGKDSINVQLAGNLKEVVNETPSSRLVIAQGIADQVTVDEKAAGSALVIENSASIKELNLDVATGVTGEGDISHLTVNAPGSNVSMLPDTITIRPGITASIAGVTMDTVDAAESSSDPRFLAGYPVARKVAPTSADAVFSTNKPGTIYWAISALTDGSVEEEDLISPPVYAGKIIKNGTIPAADSKTELTTKLTGLTTDGSYYLSAVLVDNRGMHSPVKVTAFTTPDDTVPAFATGYPYMSRTTKEDPQVTIMTNKSCMLYYALLPKGASAPKAADFKANAVTGNLGFGSVDVVKNSTIPITVNSVTLDELATYDLYLWLTDYDGAKSSAVKKLSFTTADTTPPIIRHIEQTDAKATAIDINYALNEPGTLYWAIVKEGEDFFRPITGQTAVPLPTDQAAKIQVENGMGSVKKGNSNASKVETDIKFTISGLQPQTAYDLYYVAKDKAGNYSSEVKKLTINTLDNQAPTVTQEFTRYNGDETDVPLADTDIRLVFSESIQGVTTGDDGSKIYKKFLVLYQTALKDKTPAAYKALADELRKHIVMYQISGGSRSQVAERTAQDTPANWVIDYRFARVTMENGKMVITLPTTSTSSTSALNLKSGATYFFHLKGITDTAVVPNRMGDQDLPQFRTVFAQINLSNSDVSFIDKDGDGMMDVSKGDIRLDMTFKMDPISTAKVPDTECWDMILWSDTSVEFMMYRRITDAEGTVITDWAPVGLNSAVITAPNQTFNGTTLRKGFTPTPLTFEALNTLDEDHTYEYGIHFTKVGILTQYEAWNSLITMKIGIAAGGSRDLGNLAGNVAERWEEFKQDQSITSIGLAYSAKGTSDELIIRRQFSDSKSPSFDMDFPHFTPGSGAVTMDLLLDRSGTIYYVIAPKTDFIPYVGGTAVTPDNDSDKAIYPNTYVPTIGNPDKDETPNLTSPDYLEIVEPKFPNSPQVKFGSASFDGATITVDVAGLEPEKGYYAYFVLKGNGETYSKVFCFQFTTTQVETPYIGLENQSPQVSLGTTIESNLDWALVANDNIPSFLRAPFYDSVNSKKTTEYETTSWYKNYDGKTTDAQGKPITPIKFTVLDALTTVANPTTQESVFDQYADDAIRIKTSEYIRRTGPAYPTAVPTDYGRLTTKGGNFNETSVSPKEMKPNVQYYFLAVARHPKGATDGFKAHGNIHLPDSVPPELLADPDGVITVITGVYETGSTTNVMATAPWQDNPHLYTYSGTVTISFSEPIYQLLTVGGVPQLKGVIVNWDTSGTSDPSKHVNILSILGGSLSNRITPGIFTNAPSTDITLAFNKIHHNESLRLFNAGFISDASSNTNGKTLVLTFKTSSNMGFLGEVAQPAFEYTWQDPPTG